MVNENLMMEICVFDDGNEKYENVDNKWIIVDRMFEGDKLKLVNVGNKNIVINSISAWKVCKIIQRCMTPPVLKECGEMNEVVDMDWEYTN